MSQEFLFLIFLALEAVMLVAIYQIFLLKMIRQAVVRHWIEEIETGRIDLPSVLANYTEDLMHNFTALLTGQKNDEGKWIHKGILHTTIPAIIDGAFGAGVKEMKKLNPEIGIMEEAMEELPWYAKTLLLKATGGDPQGFLKGLQGGGGGSAQPTGTDRHGRPLGRGRGD